jgi:hypothetical protein
MTDMFISPIGLHSEAVAAYEEFRITPWMIKSITVHATNTARTASAIRFIGLPPFGLMCPSTRVLSFLRRA